MNDPMMFLPLILLAVMLILMWRGNKQRQSMMNEMRTKLVPGAEVMTQAGIFGTLVEIDTDSNIATLEVSPGVEIRVHSQTVATVVEPKVPNDASSLDVDLAEADSQHLDSPAADVDSAGVDSTEYDNTGLDDTGSNGRTNS